MNINRIREYYDGPEYLAKLKQRLENVRVLSIDPLSRMQTAKDIYAHGYEGFKRYCEDILFLIIPEFADAIKPFFLFPYQETIIQKLEWAENFGGDVEILVDKPRGMGITWLIVAYFNWKWMFRPNWTAFVLSRTELEVDDGTNVPGNSIFSKFRWIIAHTPKWMLPAGYKPKGEKGTATDSTLKIINPEIGSGIFGSSTNSNAGRSRRYSIILVDECFAIDRFTETHRSLESVARIGVYISTTKASIEAKKFKDNIEKAGNYISLDWRDHPWKDDEWYKEKLAKAEFDPELMKEIDKGYSVSVKEQYYPEIAQAKVVKMPYNPNLPIYQFLDFGKGDLTVIGWAQFDGNQINIVECYSNKGKGKADWYAPFMNPECELDPSYTYNPVQLEFMKKVRAFKKPTLWLGEHAHTIRSMASGESIASTLARKGIRIIYNNFAITYEPRRTATSTLLSKMIFNEDSQGVLDLYDGITNSKYKKSTASKTSSMEPEHTDEIADYRAALENLCVNVGRIFKYQRKQTSEGRMRDGGFAQKLISFLRV